MLGAMRGRPAGVLLASALLLGGAPPARAAPHGRVVRVERNTISVVPRFCSMGGRRGEGTCFGQPREGEVIEVVDQMGKTVRGTFVIESVTEAAELAALGLCVSTGVRTVRGAYGNGADEGGRAWGLRGVKLNRKVARLVDAQPPSGRTDESVNVALDVDGNGRPDVILTQYSCDASGAPSSSGDGRCFDTYMEQHGGMRRVQQDILKTCH